MFVIDPGEQSQGQNCFGKIAVATRPLAGAFNGHGSRTWVWKATPPILYKSLIYNDFIHIELTPSHHFIPLPGPPAVGRRPWAARRLPGAHQRIVARSSPLQSASVSTSAPCPATAERPPRLCTPWSACVVVHALQVRRSIPSTLNVVVHALHNPNSGATPRINPPTWSPASIEIGPIPEFPYLIGDSCPDPQTTNTVVILISRTSISSFWLL